MACLLPTDKHKEWSNKLWTSTDAIFFIDEQYATEYNKLEGADSIEELIQIEKYKKMIENQQKIHQEEVNQYNKLSQSYNGIFLDSIQKQARFFRNIREKVRRSKDGKYTLNTKHKSDKGWSYDDVVFATLNEAMDRSNLDTADKYNYKINAVNKNEYIKNLDKIGHEIIPFNIKLDSANEDNLYIIIGSGNAGVAVSPKGEILGLFDNTENRKASELLMPLAMELGGFYLSTYINNDNSDKDVQFLYKFGARFELLNKTNKIKIHSMNDKEVNYLGHAIIRKNFFAALNSRYDLKRGEPLFNTNITENYNDVMSWIQKNISPISDMIHNIYDVDLSNVKYPVENDYIQQHSKPQLAGYDDNNNKIQGIDISSNSSDELGRLLTNVGNNMDLDIGGVHYENVEHAYQSLKSGTFDEDYYNDAIKKGIRTHKVQSDKKADTEINPTTGNSHNYDLMVNLIMAKFYAHHDLVDKIDERGGMEFLDKSSHFKNKNGYWESGEKGGNMFMKALKQAYERTKYFDEHPEEQHIDTGEIEPEQSITQPTATPSQPNSNDLLAQVTALKQKHQQGQQPVQPQQSGTNDMLAQVKALKQQQQQEQKQKVGDWRKQTQEQLSQVDQDLANLYESDVKTTQGTDTPIQQLMDKGFTVPNINDLVEFCGREFSNQLDDIVLRAKKTIDETLQQQQKYLEDIRKHIPVSREDMANRDRAIEVYENNIQHTIEFRNKLYDKDTERIAVLEQYGVQPVIQGIKSKIKKIASDPEHIYDSTLCLFDDKQLNEYNKIWKRVDDEAFNLLMPQAVSLIEYNENIKIIIPRGKTDQSYSQQSTRDTEDDYKEITEDEYGEYVGGSDGWSFKSRDVNPIESARVAVRRVLGNIVNFVGEDMDAVPNSIGMHQYVNEQYAHCLLLNYFSQHVRISDDFMYKDNDGEKHLAPVFDELQDQYPWLVQVFNETSKDQFDAIFYSDMRKDKINYVGISGRGNMYLVNPSASANNAINNARSLYELGIETEWTIWNSAHLPKNQYKDKAGIWWRINKELKKYRDDLTGGRGRKIVNWDENTAEGENNINGAAIWFKRCFEMVGINVDHDRLRDELKKKKKREDIFRASSYAIEIARNFMQHKHAHIFDININDYKNLSDKIGYLATGYNQVTVNTRGKTIQSYAAPSYLDSLVKKLNDDPHKIIDFLENEYGQDEWFRDKDTGEWRCKWIKILYDNAKAVLDGRKPQGYDMFGGNDIALTELNMIDDTPFRKCTPEQMEQFALKAYFSTGENSHYGWFQLPIYADAPATNFIRFRKFNTERFYHLIDDDGNDTWKTKEQFSEKEYKRTLGNTDWDENDENNSRVVSVQQQVVRALRDIVMQELNRINKTKRQKAKGVTLVQNMEKNGEKFNFFPELNDTSIDYVREFHEAKDKALEDGDLDALYRAIDTAVTEYMERGFDRYMKGVDNIAMARIVNTKMSSSEFMRDQLGRVVGRSSTLSADEYVAAMADYYYNSVFANSQMIEMTTTDLAYYNGAIDFQKRYKEVHASGPKLFVNSKYGRKYQRVICLADNIVPTTTIGDVRTSLDKALKEKRITKEDHDTFLAKFLEINTTDGAAMRTLPSYRAMVDMLGKWTEPMNETFERLANGTYTSADLHTVFCQLKPFTFSTPNVNDGLGGKSRIPVQHKDSEIPLLAIYDIIGSAITKSDKLRALNRFMVDNDIDLAVFPSAMKNGGQGVVDINYSPYKVAEALDKIQLENNGYNYIEVGGNTYTFNDEIDKDGKRLPLATNYYEMMAKFAQKVIKGDISQDDYDRIYNYFQPDYGEVTDILNGYITSQADENDRMETIVGNDGKQHTYNTTFVTTLDNEDIVIAQPTPEHLIDRKVVFGSQILNNIVAGLPEKISIPLHSKNAVGGATYLNGKDDIRAMYYRMFTENMLDSFKELRELFTDDEPEHEVNGVKVGKKNPRTAKEKLRDRFLHMIQGNPKYGVDMMNSLELVDTKYGKDFNIPLSSPTMIDKMSGLVNSLFKNNITRRFIKGGTAYIMSDYGVTDLKVQRKSNGRIEYVECYLPAWSKQFFTDFMKPIYDDNGKKIGEKIDFETIKKECPEILKMIGYRTPTEGKWSMCPLKVKGFLPQQLGSSIILPADIVAHAGSDFDIDKLFLIMPEFHTYKDEKTGKTKIKMVEYDDDKLPQENSVAQRNNRIFDIMYNILTADGVDVEFNSPSMFDNITKQANVYEVWNSPYMMRKLAEEYNKGKPISFKKLFRFDPEKLEKFLKINRDTVDPLSPSTYPYFFNMNNTGQLTLGIYALYNASHSKMQNHSFGIKPKWQYRINGRLIDRLDKETITLKNGTHQSIFKSMSEFLAAAPDNAKKPVLDKIGQNVFTAPFTGFLIRSGMTIEEVGLFMNMRQVKSMLATIAQDGYYKARKEWLGAALVDQIDKEKWNKDNSDRNLTTQKMIEQIEFDNASDEEREKYRTKEEDQVVDGKGDIINLYQTPVDQMFLARLFFDMWDMSSNLNTFVNIGRADSAKGAVGITIAEAMSRRVLLDNYVIRSASANFPFSGVENTIQDGYLLDDNGNLLSEDEMRERINHSPMPMLQTFQSLGIDAATVLPANLFLQLHPVMTSIVRDVIDGADFASISNADLDWIYNMATVFALSDTDIFGDSKKNSKSTYLGKRHFYLYKFPSLFQQIVNRHPKIANLSVIRHMGVEDNRILFRQGVAVKGSLLDQYMRELESLFYMKNVNGDTTLQKDARQLAIGLFMYNYYSGYTFGPNTFFQFFSSMFTKNFPEYIEAIRQAQSKMDSDPMMWQRFKEQLYVNNPELAKSTYIDWSQNGISKDNGNTMRLEKKYTVEYAKNQMAEWILNTDANNRRTLYHMVSANEFMDQAIYKAVKDNGTAEVAFNAREIGDPDSGISSGDAIVSKIDELDRQYYEQIKAKEVKDPTTDTMKDPNANKDRQQISSPFSQQYIQQQQGDIPVAENSVSDEAHKKKLEAVQRMLGMKQPFNPQTVSESDPVDLSNNQLPETRGVQQQVNKKEQFPPTGEQENNQTRCK